MKLCPSCKNEFSGGEIFCPNDGARLTTPSQMVSAPEPGADPLLGTILSERYRILRQIGEGGMGLVYEAEHIAIEKRVALKVLRDDFSGRPDVVERFKQEARSASRIGNAHIVDISDFGVTPSGASYFAMELLEGEDLADVLEREGYVSIERASDILLQCCQALGAAHAKGIVHRDMKPENIFLTVRDGRADFVKIVDFGIAKMSDIETVGAPGRKLTKTGMIFGTPEYMSPEQASGKGVLDHRVDIYALAVIFFEMITGRVPFVGDTFMGILTQHMFEDPPPIAEVNPHVEIPAPILAVLAKGLTKDPEERFRSCAEMADALENALAGRGDVTLPGFGVRTGASDRTPRPMHPTSAIEIPVTRPDRSRRGLALAGAAVVVLAALGGGALWYSGGQGRADDGERPVADAAGGASDDAFITTEAADAGPGEPGAHDGYPTPADAGPAYVRVQVNTSPGGARVFVEGQGEVCSPTPCSFETPAGEPITVRARRGRTEGDTALAPRANTVVELEMRPTRRPRRTDGKRRGGGGSSGDLKVPDIFR